MDAGKVAKAGRDAGFALAAVGAVGLAGFAFYKLWSSLGEVLTAGGKTASNVADGVANATSGLPELGQGVGTVVGDAGGLLSGASGWILQKQRPTATASDYKSSRQALRLTLEGHEDLSTSLGWTAGIPFVRQVTQAGKRNTARFRVTNQAGQPVAGAVVKGTTIQRLFPSADMQAVTGEDGRVAFDYTLPTGINNAGDDDVLFRAFHESYNPSQEVRVD